MAESSDDRAAGCVRGFSKTGCNYRPDRACCAIFLNPGFAPPVPWELLAFEVRRRVEFGVQVRLRRADNVLRFKGLDGCVSGSPGGRWGAACPLFNYS